MDLTEVWISHKKIGLIPKKKHEKKIKIPRGTVWMNKFAKKYVAWNKFMCRNYDIFVSQIKSQAHRVTKIFFIGPFVVQKVWKVCKNYFGQSENKSYGFWIPHYIVFRYKKDLHRYTQVIYRIYPNIRSTKITFFSARMYVIKLNLCEKVLWSESF